MTRKTITIIILALIIAGTIDYNHFFSKPIKVETLIYQKVTSGIDKGYYSKRYQVKNQFLRIENSSISDISNIFEEIILLDQSGINQSVKEIEIWNSNNLESTTYYIFDDLNKGIYTLILTDHTGKEYKKPIVLINDNITIQKSELLNWLTLS